MTSPDAFNASDATERLKTLLQGPASDLLDYIAQCPSESALHDVRQCLHLSVVENSANPSRLTQLHRALQKRCVTLVAECMHQEGKAKPGFHIAILLLGSGAREEMCLAPDQDNALIYAPAEDELKPDEKLWMAEFAERCNHSLDKIGYPLCSGGIMASQAAWHKSLPGWYEQLDYVIAHPNEKGARWANILFDFHTLWGNPHLGEQLKTRIHDRKNALFPLLRAMAEHDAEGRPALGMFSQLVAGGRDERGAYIDLKRNGLRILADGIRILAVSEGIQSSSTHQKLNALEQRGSLPKAFIEQLHEAHEFLLALLLQHQLNCIESGKNIDALYPIKKLTGKTKQNLRKSMLSLRHLQDRIQTHFDLKTF